MTARLVGRERLLLIVAATVFGVIVLGLVLFVPKFQDVRIARQQAQRRQAELARTAALVQTEAAIAERHQTAKRALEDLLERIPSGPQLTALIDDLDHALELSRVRLVQVTFSAAQANAPGAGNQSGGPTSSLSTLNFQLQVRGTYPEVRTLLAALENASRVIAVDRLALANAGDAVLADLSLRAFYFR